MEIKVLLHNIRSIENVGSILRTSDGLGINEVFLSGWTALADKELPHIEEKLWQKLNKTALGAEKTVKITRLGKNFKYVEKAISEIKNKEFIVLGLENNIDKNREMVYNINRKLSMMGRQKILLILGEEVDGICEELMNLVDIFVEIPMRGKKESFNVAIAYAILAYELSKAY